MGKGATMSVKVSTYETEFDLQLKPNSNGKELIDTIVNLTGIRETWYFGLLFTDTSNEEAWLRPEKKISAQGVKTPAKFTFKFKYFPENVTDEIIQDVTLRLLYKQIRNDILTELIYCPAEKAVLLSSLSVQVKLGDFEAATHTAGYLANEKLLPPKILSQHKLSIEEWEEKVSQFHKGHRGKSSEEAMLEYLKLAQDLEMYGVTYFPVTNKKGTDVLLGVDALGINVYETGDRFNPKVSFPWSEIRKVSYRGEKFTIRFTSKDNPAHTVKGKTPKTAKKIVMLAKGNHDMYKRRRMPDGLEVQQMKAQKEQEKKARERERNALRREMQMRERLEKAQEEMEQAYKILQADMDKRKSELEEANSKISKLEEQLRETQAAREELERQQSELKEMLEKLERDREMEASEKQKLEDDIREKQEEIERARAMVEEKEEHTRSLQEEVERAKQELQKSSDALQQSAASHQPPQILIRNGSVSSSSSSESETGDAIRRKKTSFGDEDREPDVNQMEILKDLRSELADTALEGADTAEDALYRENLAQGRDKFKTLRDVRKGNTQRRIDLFENL